MPKVIKDTEREKLIDRKREKQKPLSKEEEKLDKRRAKEDAAKLRKLIDKEKEQEKKLKRKSKQTSKGGTSDTAQTTSLPDFIQSEKNFIPLFLERCVEFIEQEGLDSEGIYRVPGNRAHVDLLYQKLQEGKFGWAFFQLTQHNIIFGFCFPESNIDIEALDIPVNAVATALKDFFSKHLPPLFDKDLMTELEEIACKLKFPFFFWSHFLYFFSDLFFPQDD